MRLQADYAGARYEGQWKMGAKHGEGVYVFEDNSVWCGMWENDQPVDTSSPQAFAPESTCPKVYVQDLLDLEQNSVLASKGVAPCKLDRWLKVAFHRMPYTQPLSPGYQCEFFTASESR
jgi:hypothetical protein